MNVRITIDTQTFVRFWLIVIGFGLLGFAIYSAQTALIIIGVAFFLAIGLNSPVTAIANKLPGNNRSLAAGLVSVIIVVLLAIFSYVAIPPIIQQSIHFIESLPKYADQFTSQSTSARTFIKENNLQPQVDSALETINRKAASWVGNISEGIISGLSSVASLAAASVIVIVLTFLMLVEGPIWLRNLWGIYVNKKRLKHHQQLVIKMYNVVTGYISGQLLVSAIGALLAGLCVYILSLIYSDVPYNLMFPTIAVTFILSLIPMFGATIAGITIALLLAFNNPLAGLIYVIYFFVYQQFENNLVSPKIQSKKVELSALTVLIAVTVGLYVFGVAGGIISIPVAGIIKVLWLDYLERRDDRIGTTADKRHKKAEEVTKKDIEALK